MDAGLGKQTGDIVSSKKSSQEEYYKYKLLEAKLKNARDPDADELLKVQSEREAIELSILRNLVEITESSPEFAQITDITGSRDRYEQARILSEVVYDKVRAEQILGFYTPGQDALKKHFTDRTAKAVAQRGSAGRTAMDATLAASGASASATAGLLRTVSAATGGGQGNTTN